MNGMPPQPGRGTMPWRSSQPRASASTFFPANSTRQLRNSRPVEVSRAETALTHAGQALVRNARAAWS